MLVLILIVNFIVSLVVFIMGFIFGQLKLWKFFNEYVGNVYDIAVENEYTRWKNWYDENVEELCS